MSRVAHINLSVPVDPPRRSRAVHAHCGLGLNVVGIHSIIRKSPFDERATRAAKLSPTLASTSLAASSVFAQRPSCNNLKDYFVSPPPPIPISLDLSTAHTLPVVNALRLTAASTILATLGGDRNLRIGCDRILDRMPYASAVAAASSSSTNGKENGNGVQQMHGRGTNKEDGSVKGLQLNLNGGASGSSSGPIKMEQQQEEEVEVESMLGIPRKVKQRYVSTHAPFLIRY